MTVTQDERATRGEPAILAGLVIRVRRATRAYKEMLEHQVREEFREGST